ncbi:MAG: phage major tail tube protein [Desulfovibrio sp.]|nr:phage major tail tube protein [Desulfovibrio sp.]
MGNQIPQLLINAKVYNASKALLGMADAEISDLEYLTESIAGLGIAGEIDLPALGHLKSITLKLKWNSVCESAIELLAPKSHQLEIYASLQNWSYSEGVLKPVGCRVSARAVPKKSGVGKFEPAKKMEPESEFEVYYLKMAIGGANMLEFDKFNFKCAISGTDYLADVRSQLGL